MTGITEGTISVTNGSAAITGAGTAWLWAGVRANSAIVIKATAGRDWYVVGADATSDTALTLSEAYAGASESGLAYEIVPVYGTADAVDALQQMRRVVRWMQDTPGLSISGVALVDDLVARAAYDDEDEGFVVWVRDCTGEDEGAGRSAIYRMGDGGSGDWSEPAWITGPIGAIGPGWTGGSYNAGTGVVTFASDDGLGFATDDLRGDTGDVGINWTGPWAAGTYQANEAVSRGGSSYVANVETTQEPPDTDWDIIAEAGDMVGPVSSTDNAIARFNGTGGSTVQDSLAIVSDTGQIGAGGAPSAMLHAKAADTEALLRLDKGSGAAAITYTYDGTYLQAVLGAPLLMSGASPFIVDGVAAYGSALSIGNAASASPTQRWQIGPGWAGAFDGWLAFRRSDQPGWTVAISESNLILASGKSIGLYSTALITSQDLGGNYAIQVASTGSGATAKQVFRNNGLGWEWQITGFAIKASLSVAGHFAVAGSLKTAGYTVAALPSASTLGAGSIIYVSDEIGGAVLAFSDGTDWRRITDRAVVS